MNLNEQIKYQQAFLEGLRRDIAAGKYPEGTKMVSAEEDIYQTLLAVRNMMKAEPCPQQYDMTDTTLTGCIKFIRRDKAWSALQQKELGTTRLKMLNAVEENLCAMQIIANRMAEQLAELPGNTLKEEQPETTQPEQPAEDEQDEEREYDPDYMGPDKYELAERQHRIQRDLK